MSAAILAILAWAWGVPVILGTCAAAVSVIYRFIPTR